MKKLIPSMISGAVASLSLIIFDKLGYDNYVSFIIAIIIGVVVSLVVINLTSIIKKHE